MGVSVARNNGAKLSHGEYLCFLDADDWWDKDFLKEMSLFIEQYPYCGLYACNYFYVKRGKLLNKLHISTGYINYFKEYLQNNAMPIQVGCACISKSVFENMSGFPIGISLGEDFLLFSKIAVEYKVAFLERQLAYYNQDVDTSHRAIARLHEPSKHMLWHLDFLEEREHNDANIKQLLDKLRVQGLKKYYISDFHCETLQELKKVDWVQQPFKIRLWYKMPQFILRLHQSVTTLMVGIKNILVNFV